MRAEIDPAVARVLAEGGPVVALESTLICHGLPRPRNLDVARAVEAAVREGGATPATVALVDGRVRVGLDGATLTALAAAADVAKCSPRDFAHVLADRRLGATTVAGTIRVAAAVGIRVMATGGIGGVHRGGEASLDVSADLHELARSGVAVVCSGAKLILDLKRTLEVLETLGVPVVAFGTSDFPAFYARESGLRVPAARDLDELAALLRAQSELGWPSGMVIANPPPAGSDLPRGELERWIQEALTWLRRSGVGGPAETPALLAALAERSGGATVAVNEALVVANAGLAGRLAARIVS